MFSVVFISGITGLIIGSFLNVVIYRHRVFLDENLSSSRGLHFRFGGRSFCPFCKKQLRWFELIPVASFIIQHGRCRGCRVLISWQYPLVELGTAAVFALIAWRYFGGWLRF